METGNSSRTKLCLTLPTLREAGNIAKSLDLARAVLDPTGLNYEILVVDDDSQDGTEEIVQAISLADPRVRVLIRRGERGLSGAILHGWENSEAEIFGVMDADRQHPAELLPKLVAAIDEGCDLAIGSRYADGGRLGDWSAVRKFLSAAAVWVTWPIQRGNVRAHDPMSGFFLVRRSAIQNIAFQRSGFKLLLEVLVRGRIRSVREVPFSFGLREQGASKANFRVAVDYARLLARLYAARILGQ